MLKVKNIFWDISDEELEEYITDQATEGASIILDLPMSTVSKMSETEKIDAFKDIYHHCPGRVYDFLDLPEEVELEDGIDPEEIANRLSDTYGYFVNTFEVEKTK